MTEEQIAQENYGLCIEDCSFLEDKTIWVASLSNGIFVYQDDNRSGKEPVAWKRLADYCNSENVDISGMYIKFRSHVIQMPDGEDVEGYYFCYGAHKEFDETMTRYHYVCGICQNQKLKYDWYTTPELIRTKSKKRNYNQDDIKSKKLILKQSFRD